MEGEVPSTSTGSVIEIKNKSLKALYGKNKASAKKIQAAKMFGKSHSNIKCIAKALQVEIPTAEVYLIDAYCAGAPMVSIEKLSSELNIHSHLTNTIARLIEQGLPTLRQIRDALNRKVSYNQIKVVLAGMIRDELDRIM
ncbi:Hypothetical predicted protein [Paramuricea clavata]|uniref:Helicase Helix-turn-helix domain-containing protein n=1 Tax=Paramuricea clavata TaxID=317549 RepID=A0A7D9HL04_PARCT|nr:Hypothetical predicted protein [Paramuricea clavata]CAB3983236.1 Hypothetical predicted protein [Paramuricea clavata]